MKISSEIALVNVWKYWKTGWNAKQFCEPLSTKHFAQLRIPYTFLISFVSPFVGISLTSPDRSFISFVKKVSDYFSFFSVSTCLVSYEVTFLLMFLSFPLPFPWFIILGVVICYHGQVFSPKFL